MEKVDPLYIFIFRTHKDSVKVLILKYEDWEVPRKDNTGDDSISDTVTYLTENFSLDPTLVAESYIEINDKRGLPFFISNNNPHLTTSLKDGHMISWDGREAEIFWAHPRRLYKITSSMGIADLYGETLDWLVDHNFAAGFLANNLEKLR